jgi:hypothetical protein
MFRKKTGIRLLRIESSVRLFSKFFAMARGLLSLCECLGKNAMLSLLEAVNSDPVSFDAWVALAHVR